MSAAPAPQYEYIDPSTCMPCFEGAPVHFDWHPTRGALLKIGREMTARARARNRDEVRLMTDEQLVGYGTRLRRQLAQAVAERWDEVAAGLVAEWLADVEKEWKWRTRVAKLGGPAVVASGASWADRAEAVKRATDLVWLICYEASDARPVGTKGWRVACPFHDDRHPSMDVDTEKHVWICRSCNVGGDAITFVELKFNLSFAEAVRHLEERLGIKPPRVSAFPKGGRRPLGAAIPV